MSTPRPQEQPQALRLADRVEAVARALPAYGFNQLPLLEAAVALRRLHAVEQVLALLPCECSHLVLVREGHALASASAGWQDISTAKPPCDGETMFIGKNDAGYVACFNSLTSDGYCFHESAESSICVMSGLRRWQRVVLPPAPKAAEAKGGVE